MNIKKYSDENVGVFCAILFTFMSAACAVAVTARAATAARPVMLTAMHYIQSANHHGDNAYYKYYIYEFHNITIPISLTISATIQATTHCHTTTPTAHLEPSSLLTDAMAATQGV